MPYVQNLLEMQLAPELLMALLPYQRQFLGWGLASTSSHTATTHSLYSAVS